MAGEFLMDIRAIRERAHREIEQGALTRAHGVDPLTAVRLLNEALAMSRRHSERARRG